MKNPLHYQFSEYDCGPTTMQNAISFLFEREEIPPEIVRNIMLYCLDCFGPDGTSGKCGTSCMAMQFLSSWLSGFGEAGHLPITSAYLSGRDVNFSQNSRLRDTLRRGGAVRAEAIEAVEHDVSDNLRWDILTREEIAHGVEHGGRAAVIFRHLIAQRVVHGIASSINIV